MSSGFFKSFDDDNVEVLGNANQNNRGNNSNNNVNTNGIDKNKFEEFKEKYKGKSDNEILNDAKEYSDKLKKQLGEEKYNRKLQELTKFEKFLNKDQRDKLHNFIDKLK